jgi:CRISPR/Cas system-associated endonuclease Cas3-HD
MQDSELITPAYDSFLDGKPSRREMQAAFNKMGNNDSELFLMLDNLNLVANCLCEKAGVTRGELDAFVEKKKAEMSAVVEAQKAAMSSEGGNE